MVRLLLLSAFFNSLFSLRSRRMKNIGSARYAREREVARVKQATLCSAAFRTINGLVIC